VLRRVDHRYIRNLRLLLVEMLTFWRKKEGKVEGIVKVKVKVG